MLLYSRYYERELSSAASYLSRLPINKPYAYLGKMSSFILLKSLIRLMPLTDLSFRVTLKDTPSILALVRLIVSLN